MTKKILIGGIVGGIVMFIWGAVSHMALGLGEAGIKQLPNEDAVLAPLPANLKESGFYFFPGMDQTPGMTKEQQKASEENWKKKYTTGPSGVLVYLAHGGEAMSPKQLLTQFATDLITSLLAACLLAAAAGALTGYGGRVLFVTLLGCLPWLAVNLPYWNWYGFPIDFTLAALADGVIGFFLAGLVLAAMVKRPVN